jgi:hypothetical protein
MAFNIIDICNVFATVTSSAGSTVMLYGWMIFCIKIISRLFMVNKGCMAVMLTVHILINRLRFFEISRIIGNFINEKFISKRPLMHFLIIER